MAGTHKRREEPEKEENLERWLLTYSDLITLLMLFFIVMYAMSSASKVKFEQLAESLTFGFTTGYSLIKQENSETSKMAREGIKSGQGENRGTTRTKTSRKIYLSNTYKQALFVLQQEIKDSKIRVDLNERGVVISLSSDVYFRKGSAELDIDRAREVLEKISNLLIGIKDEGNDVRVEGFTDNTLTDKSGPWISNWELASSRANNVLYYLVDFGTPPEMLSSASYGEYRPIFPNDSEEHRARNRRVDIAISRAE
jgi:chemotaxis protein MotB